MIPSQILSNCSLFRDFTETGLQIIASIAIPRTLPAGSPVFVENMVGDSFFVLAEGEVSIRMQDGEGNERHLATLGPGESFGELSLIHQSPRMVSAIATSQVSLVELRHRDFVHLQQQKPQACLKLLLAITESFARHLQANRETLRSRVFP